LQYTTEDNGEEPIMDDDFTPPEVREALENRLEGIRARASEADYEELITKVDSLGRGHLNSRLQARSLPPNIFMIDTVYIECLRVHGDGPYDFWYSMHRVDFGDGLFYIFYRGVFITHAIYVEKALVKADFDTIQIGDHISAVEAIDPATTQWIEETQPEWQEFNSKHLLLDGLLVIGYERSADGSFEVSALNFYGDFIYNTPFLETLDFTIREQDFPR